MASAPPHDPAAVMRDALLQVIHHLQGAQQLQSSAMQTQQAAQGILQSHAVRLGERAGSSQAQEDWDSVVAGLSQQQSAQFLQSQSLQAQQTVSSMLQGLLHQLSGLPQPNDPAARAASAQQPPAPAPDAAPAPPQPSAKRVRTGVSSSSSLPLIG